MAEEQSTNEEWNEVDVKASEEENKVEDYLEDLSEDEDYYIGTYSDDFNFIADDEEVDDMKL